MIRNYQEIDILCVKNRQDMLQNGYLTQKWGKDDYLSVMLTLFNESFTINFKVVTSDAYPIYLAKCSKKAQTFCNK